MVGRDIIITIVCCVWEADLLPELSRDGDLLLHGTQSPAQRRINRDEDCKDASGLKDQPEKG